jgi:hypothetical protein
MDGISFVKKMGTDDRQAEACRGARFAPGREAASGDEVEAALGVAHTMIGQALLRYRAAQESDGQDLIEHHDSEETLWPLFAHFLQQAVHGSVTLRAANCSWLITGRRGSSAVGRLQEGLLSSGARLVMLADDDSVDYPDVAERLADLQRLGAEVRVHRAELPDMLVLDRAAVVLRSREPRGNPGDAALTLIRIPEIVAAMNKMVAAASSSAVDLTTFRRGLAIRDGLTERVLFMLRMGYKDEAAARALGLSVRTYRRHVASVMDALDVTSRFQAGARASLLGF